METVSTVQAPRRRGRGFAGMDPAKQRAAASKGGRTAHEKGTAHTWTAEEAKEAGSKGGKAVSSIRGHMAAIGRRGGKARARKIGDHDVRAY